MDYSIDKKFVNGFTISLPKNILNKEMGRRELRAFSNESSWLFGSLRRVSSDVQPGYQSVRGEAGRPGGSGGGLPPGSQVSNL